MTNPKPALAWVAIIALGSPFEVPLWGGGHCFRLFWSVYRGASDICAGGFDTRYVEPQFASSAQYSGDFGGVFHLCGP